MRIAVVGATGRIGRLTSQALEKAGHEVVPISRSHGVDVLSDDLRPVLKGVETVVDVTNCTARQPTETVRFFTTATNRLLEAERDVGATHHVLLSIACLYRVIGNAHYAGKRAQEVAVETGGVPYTIVPATQFHDFGAMVASWTEVDGVSTIAPLLLQPIAPEDVADILARIAVGPPQGRYRDVAGPETQDLVDMTRRTYAAMGKSIKLVPTWDGIFGPEMSGNVLLPGPDAEIAPTTFDEWLARLGEAEAR
jgi:uncharacterized protein YbjT (DUF2867 family)